MVVELTRFEPDASALRRTARRTDDPRQACRLLAIALVLEGAPRAEAARAGGMDRQTLRDWVHRYNAAGIAGLRDQARSGRRARLSPAQTQVLAEIVKAGPDVAKHGVVRWRCVDLKGEIQSRFGVDLSLRQVERILKQLNFARLSTRPRHPQADPEAQAAHKKTSPA
jgi:transposase